MTVKLTDTLIRHARSVYDALFESSELEEVQGGKLRVFRGSLTAVYDGLGISRSYYTPLVSLLKENECVTFIQRGSRGVDSVIVLHQRPSEAGMILPPLTGRSHGAKVEARLTAIEKQLGGISIVEALKDHERRLKGLESKRGGRVSGKTS